MKTVPLKVNVSSVKINILLNGAITAKVKLIFLSWKEIPDYLQIICLLIHQYSYIKMSELKLQVSMISHEIISIVT